MGGIAKAFARLGKKVERGLGVASKKAKGVAHGTYELTIGISQKENQDRVGNDNLHDLYETAMSKRRKGEIHGNPEMVRLKEILGQNGLTLRQFEEKFVNSYKEIGY